MRCNQNRSSIDKVPTELEGSNMKGQNQEPLHKQDLKAQKRLKLRQLYKHMLHMDDNSILLRD